MAGREAVTYARSRRATKRAQSRRPRTCPIRVLTHFGAAVLVAGLIRAAACAPATPPAHGSDSASARARYKPGASLAARLCECRECFEATCCDGDRENDESAPTDPTQLGVAVKACGRCV